MNNNEAKECRLLSIICNDEKDWCDTYCCKCEEISDCDHKQLLQIKEREKELEERNDKLCLRVTELATELICEQKKSRTLKIENEKLEKIAEIAMKMKRTWDEFDEVNEREIEQLTQKLEKAREYLNAIVNGTHFTEDLSGHLIELAQQALKELNT